MMMSTNLKWFQVQNETDATHKYIRTIIITFASFYRSIVLKRLK